MSSSEGTRHEAVAKSEVLQCENGILSHFSQFLFMCFALLPLGSWCLIPGVTGRYLKVECLVNFTCLLTSVGVANSQ